MLLNTNAGFAFYWANHPVHGTDFKALLPPDGPSYQELVPPELRSLDEAALNDALMARGWGFVAADPGRYLRLSLSRVKDYFMFWPSPDSGRLSNLARVLSFGLALPFMLYGLWRSRRDWRRCLPVHLYTGCYVMLHLLSWALVRYRLPVDGVLLVFAGLGASALPWLMMKNGGTDNFLGLIKDVGAGQNFNAVLKRRYDTDLVKLQEEIESELKSR